MENDSTGNTEETENIHQVKASQSIFAYGLMGWLIGTFPLVLYFAIDLYLEKYIHQSSSESIKSTVTYFLIIIVVCSIVGAIMGGFVGVLMIWARQKDRMSPVGFSPLFGLMWAVVTGGMGGIPAFILFFFIGIIIGAMIAAPFGIIGFTLFSIVYECGTARRQVSWWETILMAIGALSLLLIGIFVWVKINNPYF